MEDTCTGCLSTGRKLFFIGDTGYYHIYTQIMNEISVSERVICVRVCWECRARLRGFHLFRQRAVRSLNDLMQQTPLHSISTLSYQAQHNLCYPEQPPELPPDVLIKTEDDVKWSAEHCEPEPFADALSPEPLSPKLLSLEPLSPKLLSPEPFSTELHSDNSDYKPLKKKKKAKIKLKTDKIKVKKKRKKKADTIDSEDNKDNLKIEETDYKDSVSEKESVKEKDSVREKEIAPVTKETVKKEKLIKEKVVKNKRDATAERPQCQECGKVFSSKKTYRYHLNVLHKGQNRYPCPRCGKVYQWKSNLGRHMRSHKAVDDGELFCAVCDKSFASVATYRQHLRLSRSHVPEADFSFACEECGKRFVNKTRLRDHIDWEHLNRIKFRCQLCDKPFKCHTSLYVHTQNVHVGKEKKDNLCHVCGKSYQNAAKLKYHITAMHSGETPYRCAHCAAAFGWYSSLYRHMREVHYKMKGNSKKAKKTKQREETPQYAPL